MERCLVHHLHQHTNKMVKCLKTKSAYISCDKCLITHPESEMDIISWLPCLPSSILGMDSSRANGYRQAKCFERKSNRLPATLSLGLYCTYQIGVVMTESDTLGRWWVTFQKDLFTSVDLLSPYVLLRHNMLITITNFDTSCSLFRVSIVKPRLWKHWTITLNYINPITRIYSILAVRPHNDNRCTLPVTWCDEAGTFMLSRSVGASRPFWVESDEWGACRHVNRYFYISHQRSRSLVLVFVFY
jgi:hypothetical protein